MVCTHLICSQEFNCNQINFILTYYNYVQSAYRKAIGNMQAQVAQSRSYNRMEAGQGKTT